MHNNYNIAQVFQKANESLHDFIPKFAKHPYLINIYFL
jgi:hypothetical protein